MKRPVSLDSLIDEVDICLELHDTRAVLGLIACDGSQRADEVARSFHDHLIQRGISNAQIEVRAITSLERDAEWLRRANRSRNTWLRTKRVVLLITASPELLRDVRRVANDLTVAPDLYGEVGGASTSRTWPQVVSDLCTRIADEHRRLDLTGLVPATAEVREVALDEIYVPVVDFEGLADRWGKQQKAKDDGSPPAHGVLVLGAPGSGKTTTLRHLALGYAEGARDPLGLGDDIVPLLAPLAAYGAELERQDRDLLSFLQLWADRWTEGDGTRVLEHLPQVLLMLDGLDELRTKALRRRVLDQIAALLKRSDGPRAVVVSARNHLVDELRSADVQVLYSVSCSRLGASDQRAFLNRFLAARFHGRRDDASRQADALAEAIDADAALSGLAQVPLLLVFLALVYELEGRLPTRRTELYHRMGELLVDRWVRSRSLAQAGYRRVRRGDALRVLAPLAWWVVRDSRKEMTHQELLDELTRIEARREDEVVARLRAQALLSLLKDDSALLRASSAVGRVNEDGSGVSVRWSFVHPTVAEYFAGVEVARVRGRRQTVLTDPFAPEWAEVLPFALGYLDFEARDEEAAGLVRAVLDRSKRRGRYDARYPLLLISLLQEEARLPTALQDAMVDRLFHLCLYNAYGWNAAVLMQRGLVAFLEDAARRSYRVQVEGWLRWYFVDLKTQPRWERLLMAGIERDRLEKYRSELHLTLDAIFTSRWAHPAGPLVHALPNLLEKYDLDQVPLCRFLSNADDWRLRLVPALRVYASLLRSKFAKANREEANALLQELYGDDAEVARAISVIWWRT